MRREADVAHAGKIFKIEQPQLGLKALTQYGGVLINLKLHYIQAQLTILRYSYS